MKKPTIILAHPVHTCGPAIARPGSIPRSEFSGRFSSSRPTQRLRDGGKEKRRGRPGAAASRSGRDVHQVHRESSDCEEECSVRSAAMQCRYEAASTVRPPSHHPSCHPRSPPRDTLRRASVVFKVIVLVNIAAARKRLFFIDLCVYKNVTQVKIVTIVQAVLNKMSMFLTNDIFPSIFCYFTKNRNMSN